MNNLLKSYFGITPIEILKLNGYDNTNYLVKTVDNKYIFKTYTDINLLPFLKAETEALKYLNSNKSFRSPKPIEFLNGGYVKKINYKKNEIIIRLLSHLEGSFIGETTSSEQITKSLGLLLAGLNLKLQFWNNSVIKSKESKWNLNSHLLSKESISQIADSSDRNLVHYFFQQYEFEVVPISQKLRKSIIHNDANEWNLLVENNSVNGIIDFGDISYSDLINELAIAVVYNSYRETDYLGWAEKLITSYNSLIPLEEIEVKVLYYKVALRLCVSACNSAMAKNINPENEYITISESKILKMLRGWVKISPYKAEDCFRKACGYKKLKTTKTSSLISRRNEVFSSNISLSYNTPVLFKKAAFQYMYDAHGNTFLDAYNNIPHVGHCHPKTIKIGQSQMSKLNTNTRYLYDSLYDYSEKLLAKFPIGLNKVFFVNSGSEASDLAIRIAKWYTKKNKLMVVEQGYHGQTQIGIEISDYKFNNSNGIGQQDHILKIPLPDYKKEIKSLDEPINGFDDQLKRNKNQIALFISETILGCAGQVPLQDNFLKNIYSKIRNQGGVCIADEVQTGFGRTGNHFWAFEDQGVIPDIVIIGKPMANGHPMGAVITSEKISNSFGEGVEFFSSFGGNPVSCEIANSVLEIIDDEELQSRAMEVGNYYKKELNKLKNDTCFIGDVRGKGLFLGIEIITLTGEANPILAQEIKNGLRNRFILVGTDGEFNNVIKTKPPLCFNKQNVDQVVSEICKILKKN